MPVFGDIIFYLSTLRNRFSTPLFVYIYIFHDLFMPLHCRACSNSYCALPERKVAFALACRNRLLHGKRARTVFTHELLT